MTDVTLAEKDPHSKVIDVRVPMLKLVIWKALVTADSLAINSLATAASTFYDRLYLLSQLRNSCVKIIA